MVDRGEVFRRAFSWLPAQFASQSDAPVGAPRRFGSTEHLSSEAIAAFVDGELRMNAHLRAAHHLVDLGVDRVRRLLALRARTRDRRHYHQQQMAFGLPHQRARAAG